MIEKDVEIPRNYKKQLPFNGVYPWRECKEIGDSFVIKRGLKKVKTAAKCFSYRNKDFKFHVEDMGGYCRVWRVE